MFNNNIKKKVMARFTERINAAQTKYNTECERINMEAEKEVESLLK